MLTRRRRLAVIVVVVLGVVALASRAFLAKDATDARFRTEPASRGPLVAGVTATGTVNPVSTVQVGTYVSGPVQAIDADFNSQVKKGQRVAKIDPRPFELRVQQAEAALTNAHAKLEKSRADLAYKQRNLERTRKLRVEGIVAADLLDVTESSVGQAVADVALQAAEVRQAEASLAEARVNLGYTDIISPVDGVVVSRSVDVGQTVAASFQTPTLFLIAEDLTQMQVDANVSESDIGSVREGERATFSVDAYPDRAFEGKVVQVRNAPQNVQNVITYDVVIGAENRDLALRPGMTANVTIETGRRDDALRVPSAALRFRPPAAMRDGGAPAGEHAAPSTGGASAGPGPRGGDAGARAGTTAAAAMEPSRVWVLRDGRPAAVAIETGLADDSYTEVTGGALAEGDPVIVAAERANAGADRPRTQPPGFGGGMPRR
jgi:HlyD family secretion protein